MSGAIDMKRILAATFIFLAAMSTIQISHAEEYSTFWKSSTVKFQNYLHGDKNYPLIFARYDSAWYLDKNSIKVEVNDPPYYIISANTAFVLLDSKSSYYENNPSALERDKNLNSYRFFYNEDETEMRLDNKSSNWKIFFLNESNENDWIYIYPPLNWGLSGTRPVCVGEAVFYAALGRKFYGNFLWEDIFFENGVTYADTDYKPAYIDIFRDEFYKTLER